MPLLTYVLTIIADILFCIEGRGEKEVNACVSLVKVLLSRIQWTYWRMTQDISVRSYVLLRSCKHCFILPTSINISDNHRLHHRRLSVGIELCSRPNHHTFYVSLNVIYITALWFCDASVWQPPAVLFCLTTLSSSQRHSWLSKWTACAQ